MLLACVGPASATGGNWVVLDLGSSRSESVCVAAAEQSFEDYGRVFGVKTTAKGSWTVYGYGLENQNIDGIVTCTFSTANAARATLVLYADSQVRAGLIAQRFEAYFVEHNARLGAEWLQRAFDRNNL